MPATLAIIAALPREIAALVKGVRPDKRLRVGGVCLYRLPTAVIVAAGMGRERATLAVEAALAEGGVTELISVGLAGSCVATLKPGSVVEADPVIDTLTGERYETGWERGVSYVLATADGIASVREKARLGAAYNAALVDMEAATVARLAAAHGLRFRAIKAISDAHDFELASLSRFAGEHGSFRTAAFAMHTALRPAQWAKTMTLGRDSARALRALNDRLSAIVRSEA